MPQARIQVSSDIMQTARALQCGGLFDLPITKKSELSWDVKLPLEEKSWNVGLIVGPSGSGKSTVARHFWPEQFTRSYSWPNDKSVIDGFPDGMPIKEIVELLNSVGFSSPPAWVRPFRVLSNGEQFRVLMARVLAENIDKIAVVDEFTSVVDRTVARIASCAIAKTIRRRKQQFIAVSCHDDIIEWLQPDWIYRPDVNLFEWRFLQRRPAIELDLARVHHSAWRIFAPYHYLSAELNVTATCFVAFWRKRPVAFTAWLPLAGRSGYRRCSRTVCLPDYQGVAIGSVLGNEIASMWAGLGYTVTDVAGHPALIAARMRAQPPVWRMFRAPSRSTRDNGRLAHLKSARAISRLTASFKYIGPSMPKPQAQRLLNSWARVNFGRTAQAC